MVQVHEKIKEKEQETPKPVAEAAVPKKEDTLLNTQMSEADGVAL